MLPSQEAEKEALYLMKEKTQKCVDCERYDAKRGWCSVTARIVTAESLRNCRFFLKSGSTSRHDESKTE